MGRSFYDASTGEILPLGTVTAEIGIGTVFSKSILLAVAGQSLRRGSARRYVASLGATTSPAAFVNIRTRSVSNRQMDPIAPAKAAQGSWWPQVIDLLAAQGIDADVVNCAIGGSTIRQWIGAYRSWTASTAYYAQRAALNGDAGDKGDFVIGGGKLFRCTTGRTRQVYGGTVDYVLASGAQISGATAPNWAGATTVGDVVTDNTCSWTLVELATAKTVADGVDPTSPHGDPLGLCARMGAAADAAKAAKVYDEVWYMWGSASAEVPLNNGAQFYANDDIVWRNRLQAFANWALTTKAASYVSLGLDPWFPDLGPNPAALATNRQLFDVLRRGLERAINSYQGGANDGKVVRGANLYNFFGFTPPVYIEGALTAGVHLTDIGNSMVAPIEAGLIVNKSAGAIVKPFIELPINYPAIIGTATVGQTVTLFDGNWDGGYTAAGAKILYRDGVAINGAAGGTYTIVSGDSGHILTLGVSKANALGTSDLVISAPVAIA